VSTTSSGSRIAATGVSVAIVKTLQSTGARHWHIDIITDSGSAASESEVDTILATMRASLHAQT
jgi:hypothetical protein